MNTFLVLICAFLGIQCNALNVFQTLQESYYFAAANSSITPMALVDYNTNATSVRVSLTSQGRNLTLRLHCFNQGTIGVQLIDTAKSLFEYPFDSRVKLANLSVTSMFPDFTAVCKGTTLSVSIDNSSHLSIIINNITLHSFFIGDLPVTKYFKHNMHTDYLLQGITPTALSVSFHSKIRAYGYPRHTSFELHPSHEPYRLFNVDPFGYDMSSPPSLTGSIPFVLVNTRQTWHGIHFNNPSEQYLTVSDSSLRCVTETGSVNLIIYPSYNSPLPIVSNNMKMTGRQAIPPRWLFGYQQAAEWYASDDVINQTLSSFRAAHIPCDGIWLPPVANFAYEAFTMANDISLSFLGWCSRNNYTVVFTAVPFLKNDTDEAESYKLVDVFVNGTLSNSVTENVAWVDFASEEGYNYYRRMATLSPIRSIWADMNEPSAYFSDEMTLFRDAKHTINGKPGEHRQLHNCYCNMHVKALFEAVDGNSELPFIVSTGFYSGIQRYGGVTLTQSSPTWEHLHSIIRQMLAMSISGVSFVGSDIGGFYDKVTPQLYVRWLQVEVFTPLFKGNYDVHTYRKEPFLFTNNIQLIQYAFNIRYTLIDHWQSKFIDSHLNDVPVIRPLFLEYSNDDKTLSIDSEWMVGSEILVSAVLNEEEYQQVYLPQGMWYNYFSEEYVISKGQWIEMQVDYEFIPVFVKGGSILLLVSTTNTPQPSKSTTYNPKTINVFLDYNDSAMAVLYWSRGQTVNDPIIEMNVEFRNNTLVWTTTMRYSSYRILEDQYINKRHYNQLKVHSVHIHASRKMNYTRAEVVTSTNSRKSMKSNSLSYKKDGSLLIKIKALPFLSNTTISLL